MKYPKAIVFKRSLSTSLTLSMALLAGCGAKSSTAITTTATTPMTGMVSAGPIKGATITAYALNADGSLGTQLATTTSTSSGTYTLALTSNTGPIEVVASGGSYTEEGSGSSVSMGSAQIRTLLTHVTSGQQVAVTPVTEIAAQNAIAAISSNPSATFASLITTSNTTLATAMGLTDITVPPADPTKSASSASNAQAAQYAIVLATISQMASTASTALGTTVNSLDMMQALATSFTYNGSFSPTVGGGTAIPVPNSSGASVSLATLLNDVGGSSSFSTAMQTATTTYVNSPTASNLGYASVTPPTFVTAPPVPSGGVTMTPPTPPANLPSQPPTEAGPPALPGQTATGAPFLAYPSATQIFTVGTETAVQPTTFLTYGGYPSACAIKDGTTELPSGFSIIPSTCTIIGTPQNTLAATQYAIVATNAAGTSQGAIVTLSAVAATETAPLLSYFSSSGISGTVGYAMTVAPSTLNDHGSTITGCAIKNGTTALPSPLVLDTTTCVISGTPSSPIAATLLTINATNAIGASADATVTISAAAPGPHIYIADDYGELACDLDATSGAIGSCLTRVNGNYAAKGTAFLENGGIAEIYGAEGGVQYCTATLATGEMTCTGGGNQGLSGASAITMHTATGGSQLTYAYVIDNRGVELCQTSGGLLSTCAVSNGGQTVPIAGQGVTSGTWVPTGIDFFTDTGGDTFAYVSSARITGEVFVCSVDNTTGVLSSCTSTISSGSPGNAWNDATSISINTVNGNTYAYVVMSVGNIFVCSIDSAAGIISSCTLSNGGVQNYPGNSPWVPVTIALSNLGGNTTHAYIANGSQTPSVYVCTVSQTDGTLSGCASTIPSGLFGQVKSALAF